MNCSECGNYKSQTDVKLIEEERNRYFRVIGCKYFRMDHNNTICLTYTSRCTHQCNIDINSTDGFCRLVWYGKCNISADGEKPKEHVMNCKICKNYEPKEILFNVGDWVYDTKRHNICRIRRFLRPRVASLLTHSFGRHQYNTCIDDLRNIIPADWTREINGVKYRAYWDAKEEYVMLYATSPSEIRRIYTESDDIAFTIYASFCRLASIPVMPYELSHGNYEYPL